MTEVENGEHVMKLAHNEAVKDMNAVNKNVCCMIYTESLSFNLVKSSYYFKKAMESIGKFDRD